MAEPSPKRRLRPAEAAPPPPEVLSQDDLRHQLLQEFTQKELALNAARKDAEQQRDAALKAKDLALEERRLAKTAETKLELQVRSQQTQLAQAQKQLEEQRQENRRLQERLKAQQEEIAQLHQELQQVKAKWQAELQSLALRERPLEVAEIEALRQAQEGSWRRALSLDLELFDKARHDLKHEELRLAELRIQLSEERNQMLKEQLDQEILHRFLQVSQDLLIFLETSTPAESHQSWRAIFLACPKHLPKA